MQQQLQTPVGTWIAEWSETFLWRCWFADAQASGIATVESPSGSKLEGSPAELQAQTALYCETGRFTWDWQTLQWQGVSPFARKVLMCCAEIPAGTTLSYAQLARQAGNAAAARAVGRVMAQNRWPLLIPCHRVVGSGGKLTGYSGGKGVATKQALLEWESQFASQQLLRFE